MKKNIKNKYVKYQFNVGNLSQEDIDFIFDNEFNEITLDYHIVNANSGRGRFSYNNDGTICDRIIDIARSRRSTKTQLIITHPALSLNKYFHVIHNTSEFLPPHIFLCFEREDGTCLFEKKENTFISADGYGFVPIQLSYDPLFL
jgi:hypothetical protein